MVATDSFKNIPASGGVSKQTIDLGGKTVTKNLVGVIRKLVTKASSGPVLIESDKGIKVILGVRNLRPVYAVAAFPTQDVIGLCFEVDEKIFGSMTKSIKGTDDGTPYTMKYIPSRDIKGEYGVDVRYGIMSGMDPNRAIIALLGNLQCSRFEHQ